MTSLLVAQPKRMACERQQLDELATNVSWFLPTGWATTAADELCLNFQIKLFEATFDGVLVYPEQFPDTPAFVRPKVTGEQWSATHQYAGTGVLCLEYGPDNWHPDVTGVDLVRSANELLWRELAHAILPSAPPVPSRHQLSLGQELRLHPRRLLLTPIFSELLEKKSTPQQPIATGTFYIGGDSVTVVTRAGDGTETTIADVPRVVETEAITRRGWLVNNPKLTDLGAVGSLTDLKVALVRLDCWPWAEELDDTYRPLVLCIPGGHTRAFLTSGGEKPVLHEYHIVEFTDETALRVPAAFAALAHTKVGIVGLGSVGSKIAISLARAGVREFVLVDDDVLAPHNLVRHQLDWHEVGFHKTEAVERALQRIAPGVVALALTQKIAGQENAQVASITLQKLSDCSMVIDATANPHVFVALASVCRRSKSTLVWGELFAGGAGALMARSRPGYDADALSIRNHVQGVLGTFPPVPDAKVGQYEAQTSDQIIVASDADVSALAASMTQFALDALCSASHSAFPVAAYLLGYKKYWVFQQPYDTIPIDCTNALQPKAPDESLTAEELASVEHLAGAVERSKRAASVSPT